VRQRKSTFRSGIKVPVHIAKRVYQYPFFCSVGSDQVGRVAERGIHKWLDKIVAHVGIILCLNVLPNYPISQINDAVPSSTAQVHVQ